MPTPLLRALFPPAQPATPGQGAPWMPAGQAVQDAVSVIAPPSVPGSTPGGMGLATAAPTMPVAGGLTTTTTGEKTDSLLDSLFPTEHMLYSADKGKKINPLTP